jgi:hypothetical protein
MKKRLAIVALVSLVIGCTHSGKQAEKEDEDESGGEVKMSLNEVPAPVRETLVSAADGQTIKTVDKELGKNGQVVYETDVKSGGKNWEIRVAPDGKLLSKKIDTEEDEKPAKKEDKKEKEDKD